MILWSLSHSKRKNKHSMCQTDNFSLCGHNQETLCQDQNSNPQKKCKLKESVRVRLCPSCEWARVGATSNIVASKLPKNTRPTPPLGRSATEGKNLRKDSEEPRRRSRKGMVERTWSALKEIPMYGFEELMNVVNDEDELLSRPKSLHAKHSGLGSTAARVQTQPIKRKLPLVGRGRARSAPIRSLVDQHMYRRQTSKETTTSTSGSWRFTEDYRTIMEEVSQSDLGSSGNEEEEDFKQMPPFPSSFRSALPAAEHQCSPQSLSSKPTPRSWRRRWKSKCNRGFEADRASLVTTMTSFIDPSQGKADTEKPSSKDANEYELWEHSPASPEFQRAARPYKRDLEWTHGRWTEKEVDPNSTGKRTSSRQHFTRSPFNDLVDHNKRYVHAMQRDLQYEQPSLDPTSASKRESVNRLFDFEQHSPYSPPALDRAPSKRQALDVTSTESRRSSRQDGSLSTIQVYLNNKNRYVNSLPRDLNSEQQWPGDSSSTPSRDLRSEREEEVERQREHEAKRLRGENTQRRREVEEQYRQEGEIQRQEDRERLEGLRKEEKSRKADELLNGAREMRGYIDYSHNRLDAK